MTSQEELERKVLNCLQESGFPFEARIARAIANLDMDAEYKDLYVAEFGERPIDRIGCLNRGVPVQCGVPYLDPVEKKSRELDVHAIVPLKVKGADLWINFFIECKDTNKIWTFGHYGLEALPTIDGKYLTFGMDFKTREDQLELRMFTPDPVLCFDPNNLCGVGKVLKKVKKEDAKQGAGRETTKIKPDNQDEIWEATITAINAARSYREAAQNLTSLDGAAKNPKLFIYIPMVATANKIFFADLSKDSPSAKEVGLAIHVHQSLAEDGTTWNHFVVPVVTESALPQFINELVKSSLRFLDRYFTWDVSAA